MARRLIASGNAIVAAGGLVYDVNSGPAGLVLVDITHIFPASPTPHTYYEIGDEDDIGAVFAGPVPGAGSLWVLTTTTPPAPGVWPHGAQRIVLVTANAHTSVKQVGTMKKSNVGKAVYIAQDVLFWIPAAALVGALPAPTNTVWDVDF